MGARRKAETGAGLHLVGDDSELAGQPVSGSSKTASAPRQVGLPAQPTALLGREAELAALNQTILDGTRLLTLTGPGGVGKTRLAIELARQLAPTFPDGTAFVEFAPGTKPNIVPSSIARVLGFQSAGRGRILDRLTRYLASRHSLLLLDNFEHIVAEASDLGEILDHCPGVTLIVTSREPLHLRWERVQPIMPLTLPDPESITVEDLQSVPSIQLFVQRARAIRPDFALTESNTADVTEICTRLDGLPLAIELQAARINVLTPSAMVDRLDEWLSLLHRPAPDVPARQHSLAATLDWGYDLLEEQDRHILQRLAVFDGGFNLDMAASVAAPETAEVEILEALASLVDKSLLMATSENGREPRFVLLETVRTYVLDRAQEQDGLEPTRKRHYDYFLAFTERFVAESGEPEDRLSHLAREYGNVQEALRWAAAHDADKEMHIAIALTPFWRAHGYAREAISHLSHAVAHQPAIDVALRVEALDQLANLLRWEGDLARATEALDEALTIARALDMPALIDRLLVDQAMVMTGQGRIGEARSVLRDALSRWRELGDARGIALTIHSQGIVELTAGEYQRARALLEESLSLFQETQESAWIAATLSLLSRVAVAQKDVARAAVLLLEALETSRDLNDRRMICVAVEQAAGLLATAAQPDSVARLLGASEVARSAGGFVRQPHEEAPYEDARVALIGRSGERSLEAWVAVGRGVALEQAADQALALLTDAASPPTRAQVVTPDTGRLSRREYEVLQLVAQGLSNKQIAHALLISENTVKYHVTSLLNKLGADSRAQTVALAAQLNLLHVVQ